MDVSGSLEQRDRLNQPDRNVYYVSRRNKELLDYFNDDNICFPLLGSAARFDEKGNICWIEYRNLKGTRETLLDQGYIQISTVDPRVRLNAPNTLYQNSIGLEIHRHLSVEDAIRAVRDHILPEEGGKEKYQVRVAKDWIQELLKFYCTGNFAWIAPDEFKEVEELTVAILRELGIEDPHQLVNDLKERGFSWLKQAGSGKDRTGRENFLVTRQALEASLKRMKEREKTINESIIRKYQFIHAALEATRYTDREILISVAKELKTMSGIVVFKYPGKTYDESTISTTVAKLEDFIGRLKLPLLRWYRSRGKYAANDLEAICDRLKSAGQATVGDVEKLAHVRDWIKYDLEKGRQAYENLPS